MDASWIITAFVVIDTLMEQLEHRSDVRAQVPDCEIITIAVVSAKYFASNHERAVQVMRGCGYVSGSISVSRFNRRLHALAETSESSRDIFDTTRFLQAQRLEAA